MFQQRSGLRGAVGQGAASESLRSGGVAAAQVSECDRSLSQGLPAAAVGSCAGLPPRLQHLVGRERHAVVEQLLGDAQSLVVVTWNVGNGAHTRLPVGERTAQCVSGPVLLGTVLFIARPIRRHESPLGPAR